MSSTDETYYVFCENGRGDAWFLEDPKYLEPLKHTPFFAISYPIRLMTTLGGPRINQKAIFLDQNDKPIVGLYAVGSETGNIE